MRPAIGQDHTETGTNLFPAQIDADHCAIAQNEPLHGCARADFAPGPVNRLRQCGYRRSQSGRP